jgi:heme/copper-type cytochrome/quinol oxidase subunit 4
MENNNNQPQEQNSNQSLEQYPSGELMLSVIQKEYDYETMRKTALETRAGVLITLLVAILTFAVTSIKIPKIKSSINDEGALFYYFSFFLIVIVVIGSIMLSLFFLLKVFFTDEYKRLDISDFISDYGKYKKDVVAMAITEKYREAITHNQDKNNKKANLYRLGVYTVIVAVFSTMILYGLSHYIGG